MFACGAQTSEGPSLVESVCAEESRRAPKQTKWRAFIVG